MVAVGSVTQLFAHHVQQGVEVNVYTAVREALYRVVSIYLGEEAAAEELSAPRPAPHATVGAR